MTESPRNSRRQETGALLNESMVYDNCLGKPLPVSYHTQWVQLLPGRTAFGEIGTPSFRAGKPLSAFSEKSGRRWGLFVFTPHHFFFFPFLCPSVCLRLFFAPASPCLFWKSWPTWPRTMGCRRRSTALSRSCLPLKETELQFAFSMSSKMRRQAGDGLRWLGVVGVSGFVGFWSKRYNLCVLSVSQAHSLLMARWSVWGSWYRAYGNENWDFAENGQMKRRQAQLCPRLIWL